MESPMLSFIVNYMSFYRSGEKTRSLTKIAIGRFYTSIDRQLQARGSSPSNTYKFIERIVSSTLPDSSVMSYNLADGALKSLQEEIQVYHEQVDQLASQVKKQQEELSEN